MKFRDIIDSPCGIRYCFDSLEPSSGYARRRLLDTEMMTDSQTLLSVFDLLRKFRSLLDAEPLRIEDIRSRLSGLREITNTLHSLRDGRMLDDIEFFEIKHLAMLGSVVSSILSDIGLSAIDLDFDRIIDILDPDCQRTGTFYIYDSYSPQLRDARSRLENEPDNDELRDEVLTIEDEVRQELSSLLRPWSEGLENLMNTLADVDLTIAKALQMKEWHCTIPSISDHTVLNGMFNPEVKASLQSSGRVFQSIDFEYFTGNTSTIIGANMGGKTVSLKTLCLLQYLFQFGFAVPGESARMELFDEIRLCVGDGQNERKGLSSFAAEMMAVDEIITLSEGKGKVLALVDEPARTTNPVEGSALVSALLKILSTRKNLAFILTTHYRVEYSGQCWKVRGLVPASNGIRMDYTLEKSSTNIVPHEAINIARELKINEKWITTAKDMLDGLR
ncbi:MAG: hypothetical protein KBT00_02095 [Bacteroidales bacterium]|nr:hypothetical protein [Candidatus Cacconaster merdequi]